MLYPKKTDATIDLFAKHLDIQFGSIHKHIIRIPYETIAKIGTEDEQRITKTVSEAVRTILLLLVLGIGHAITSFSCMLQDARFTVY